MAKIETITFQSCGLKCVADLYLPDPEKYPFPRAGVVMGHGTAMIRTLLNPQATYFSDAGYVAMAIDYRTFGDSEGEPRAQIFPLDQVS